MPKALREKPIREDMYQAVVKMWDGTEKPVGPKAGKLFIEMFVSAINRQVVLGHEKSWMSAHVVPVPRVFAS